MYILKFKCPKCGKEFTVQSNDILLIIPERGNPEIQCPGCGTWVESM